MLDQVQKAVREALTVEQQVFVTLNFAGIAKFIESPEGKEHLQLFVSAWQESVKPKIPTSGAN